MFAVAVLDLIPLPTTSFPLPRMSEPNSMSVVSDPQHAIKLLRALGGFREASDFCDAVLLVEEQEIPVPKNILAAASPYIR